MVIGDWGLGICVKVSLCRSVGCVYVCTCVRVYLFTRVRREHVVKNPIRANRGERENERGHEVEGDVARDAGETRQHGDEYVAEVIIGNGVTRHPRVVGRERGRAQDRVDEGQSGLAARTRARKAKESRKRSSVVRMTRVFDLSQAVRDAR